jgi:phosphopantetheinyl transferase
MHIQVKEHQRPPVKFNATNHSLIHLKQPLKDKERFARLQEERHTYKKKAYQYTRQLTSQKTYCRPGELHNTEGKKYQPRIFCLSKLFFNDGELKAFSEQQENQQQS